jgi:hypothetical protein
MGPSTALATQWAHAYILAGRRSSLREHACNSDNHLYRAESLTCSSMSRYSYTADGLYVACWQL